MQAWSQPARDRILQLKNDYILEVFIATGRPVRVPLVEGQSARGPRTAISRAAGSRGLSVETVEGDGFVAVRKTDEPRTRKEAGALSRGAAAAGAAIQAAGLRTRSRASAGVATVVALSKHIQRLHAAINVHELPEDPAVGLRILSTRGIPMTEARAMPAAVESELYSRPPHVAFPSGVIRPTR